MTDLADYKRLLRETDDLKRRSRRARDSADLASAAELLRNAIRLLEPHVDVKSMNARELASPDLRQLAAQLADCYGSLGGILRRQQEYKAAIKAYQKGKAIEQTEAFRISNSYNQVQFLVLTILREPASIGSLDRELESAIHALRRQIITTRTEDPWAYSDLGLLYALSGDETEASSAWDEMDSLKPVRSVYSSGLPILKELAEALPKKSFLAQSIERFDRMAQGS